MTRPHAQSVGALELAVFLVELALLAALSVAGARLGSAAMAIVLAVLLPFIAAVLWGRYLAPRATRRMLHPARLVAKLILVVVASGLLAVSGAPVWAAAFVVLAGAIVTIGESRAPAIDARP